MSKKTIIIIGFIIFLSIIIHNSHVRSKIKDIESVGFIEDKFTVESVIESAFENKTKKNESFKSLNVGSVQTIKIANKEYEVVLVETRTDLFGNRVGIFEFNFGLRKRIYKIAEEDYNFKYSIKY